MHSSPAPGSARAAIALCRHVARRTARIALPALALAAVPLPLSAQTASVTIVGPLTKTYDGTPLYVSATTNPSGLNTRISYRNVRGEPTGAPLNAGFYTAVATVEDSTYSGSATAELRIDKLPVEIVLRGLSQVVDGTPRIVRATSSVDAPIRVQYGDTIIPPIHAGTYSVGAAFDHPNYTNSAFAWFTLVVAKARTAIGFGPLPASLTVGVPFPIAATATSRRPVQLAVLSGNATLDGGNLTLHDTAPATIRATHAADRDYELATAEWTLTTTRRTQMIAFTVPTDRVQSAGPLTLSAAASSGLPVSFAVAAGPATLSGTTLSFSGEGLVVLRATQDGNGEFNAAPAVVRTIRVHAAPPPTINTQLVDAIALTGGSAAFAVGASDPNPLSYYWLFRGEPIGGPMNSAIAFSSLDPSRAGEVSVFVVSPTGAILSRSATLAVVDAPPPDAPAPPPGQSRDIGSVTPAGSSSVSGSSVSAHAAGADIWDRADAFHYRYQTFQGDGEIVAEVGSLGNTHPWAKAGLMIRESLAADARNVFAFVNPQFLVTLQHRATPGGLTSAGSSVWGGAPRWLRLTRAGNVFSAFHSNWGADPGSTWTPLGSVTLDLPASILVGLAVTSHVDGTSTSTSFNQVRVRDSTSAPAPPALPAPTGLSAAAYSPTALFLTWSDRTTNEEYFEVQSSTDGVNFTRLATRTANATWLEVTGLAPGAAYHFRVRAVRGTASSEFSNTASITMAGAASPPPPPPAVAAPTGLTAAAISSSTITLTWTDNAADETGFEVQRSTDNASFTTIATLAANTAGTQNSGLAPATAYYFRVRAIRGSAMSAFSNVATVTTSGASPPPPSGTWQSADIGAVAAAGSASESGGTVTLRASGADIWDNADEFRFHSQSWTGDGEIVARITSLADTHSWAKAGVMFREALTTGSRHVFMCLSAGNGTALQRRVATGAASESTSGSGSSALPRWLRLVRAGNTFTGFESSNGINWTQVGAVTLALPASIHVGLAATSHHDGVLTTATFDGVVVRSGAAPPPPTTTLAAPSGLAATATSSSAVALSWTDNTTSETGFELERSLDGASFTALATVGANVTSYSASGLAAATTYFFRVRAVQGETRSTYSATASATTSGTSAPPPPTGTWQSGDIGAVGAAGSSSEASGVITLTGSGEDIWGAADEFRFSYLSLAGDGEIVARVTSLTDTHAWAKAGVMLRESIAAGSRHVFMCVSATNGTALQRRPTTGGASDSTAGGSSALPKWLRLVRSGNTFTGSESVDGATWTVVGSVTIDASATLLAGVAVTSHNDGTIATARFDNVRVAAGTAPPPPPPPPPTATWSNQDIGAVGLAGSIETAGNTITIRGSGADIWDAADAFRFVYRTLPGDCIVEAQITSLTDTHAWAKAGVMIRETLAPNARNVFAFLTPANGVAVQSRAATGANTSFQPGPWGAAPPYWVRLVRAGGQISAFVSANGTTWTLVRSHEFPAGVSAHVGFAVTSHDNTRLTTAVFSDPFVQ